MNQLTVATTALLVLAHSVFGCDTLSLQSEACNAPQLCLASEHHVHASQGSRTLNCHGNGHETDTADDHSNQESPQRDHSCRHDQCQWIVSKADSSANFQQLDSSLAASFCSSATMAPSSLPSEAIFMRAGASSFAPPLRLHLRLGVLLI